MKWAGFPDSDNTWEPAANVLDPALISRFEAEQAEYDAAVAAAEKEPQPPGSTWLENGGAELEPLLAFTTLVCVRWLLKFAKGEVMPELNGVVPAWQQLPAEAVVKVEQLRSSTWDSGLPVGVLGDRLCEGLHLSLPR